VIFLDSEGHVHELWHAGSGGWQHNDLTQLAGASAYLAAVPQLIGGGPGSLIHGYVTVFNSEQHVNYLDSDGHVHELWYSDWGGWQHNDLTQLAGATGYPAAPGSSLDGYATVYNGQQHVNYIGTDGLIHELWYQDGGGLPWQHTALTEQAQAPPPSADSPLDGYQTAFSSQQHVNYLDSDGHVHELWYQSPQGPWLHNDLTQLAGADGSPASPGSALDGYVT